MSKKDVLQECLSSASGAIKEEERLVILELGSRQSICKSKSLVESLKSSSLALVHLLLKEYIAINSLGDDFPLPRPTTAFLADHESLDNHFLYDEIHYDIQRLDDVLRRKQEMNEYQTAAFQALDEALTFADTLP